MAWAFRKREEETVAPPERDAAHVVEGDGEHPSSNPELAERLRRLQWPKAPAGARERVLESILRDAPKPRPMPEPGPGRD